MDGAGAGDAKAPTTGRSSDKQTIPAASHGFIHGGTIAIAGAILTGGLVVASLIPSLIGAKSPPDVEPTLSALATSEIGDAIPTLDPRTSAAAVADAKSCKAPMAWVVLVNRPGKPNGTVRIHSGAYVSPTFHVTDVPQRIAIPYPAPYPTGRGVLSLVGDANDLWFYLTPGRFIETLNGVASINVVWKPGNPC